MAHEIKHRLCEVFLIRDPEREEQITFTVDTKSWMLNLYGPYGAFFWKWKPLSEEHESFFQFLCAIELDTLATNLKPAKHKGEFKKLHKRFWAGFVDALTMRIEQGHIP